MDRNPWEEFLDQVEKDQDLTKLRKVYVVGGDHLVSKMFNNHKDYVTVHNINTADLLCFTGGADVSPHLYGEQNRYSHVSPVRDEDETHLFKTFREVPKVGICRGGQFLNVMSGGKMYQDVDQHTMSHDVVDFTGRKFRVTSTHHQMMRPSEDAGILATACHKNDYVQTDQKTLPGLYGYEVLYYGDTQSLCFQPHPEYSNCPRETTDWFFELVDTFLFTGEKE